MHRVSNREDYEDPRDYDPWRVKNETKSCVSASPPALRRRKFHYRHAPGLGGLRRARPDSANAGWRNASFRGYADYMQTAEFDDSLEGCISLA